MTTIFSVHEGDLPSESWQDRPQSALSWRTLVGSKPGQSKSLTCGIATFPPGEGRLERHRHQHEEVYYVTEGVGFVCVNDTKIEVRAGSCVCIPGDAWHSVENTGPTALRIFYTFATAHFDDIAYVYAADSADE